MSLTQINDKCVAVIATENYLKELAITVFNVCKFLPKDIDLIILLDFENSTLDKLSKLHSNIKFKKINKDRYKHLSFENPWRKWKYNCGYRFEIFDLHEYNKICYIDLDIIIKNNFLDIFDYADDIGFCLNRVGSIPEFKKIQGFNAGICVVGKKYINVNTVNKLISIAARKDYSSDEAVLFAYFGNKFTIMPSRFNTLSSFIDNPSAYNDADIVHFIGHNKPWASSLQEAFDDYVKRFIGLVNCSFLYTKYREYRDNTLMELKAYGIN